MVNLFEGFEVKKAKKTTVKKQTAKKLVLGDDIKPMGVSKALFGDQYKAEEKKLLKKTKLVAASGALNSEKILKSAQTALKDKLALIRTEVYRVLGKQRINTIVIKDKESLKKYIDKAIQVGRIAVDTETNNSLDPITCKLMGLCLYVPGEKQAYIPINHRNSTTHERLAWQLTEQDCKDQLQRLLDNNVYVVMHNGKFDYKVIVCTCDIEVKPNWDTLIAAKLLDENEFSAGLKQLYIKYIDPSQEKYSIDHLFLNVEYADVDPDIFALYAATDSMMTDALYLWQKPRLEAYKNEPGEYGKSLYDLFTDVEMPCVISTAKMELNGIGFDKEYAGRLKTRFEHELQEIDTELGKLLDSYEALISAWRAAPENNTQTRVYVPEKTKMSQDKIELTYPYIDEDGRRYKIGKSKASQLETPISLGSPVQLAILFFDILKLDNDGERGTGEEVLEKLKSQTPLAGLLLKRRGVVKLLDAFINSLPENVNPKTGKIHCHFNQYGAATGRFSSSEPNLQQIPSHMKSIRMLFTADPGYKLIGSDFSQQEVRVLAELSKDPALIKSYQENKDIYATVASGVYHMDYWDCMEHHQDGTPNPEGKKRRASCKSIVLGIMYSRGPKAIAEQIGSDVSVAEDIIANFYKSFPKVKDWMENSLATLKSKQYVEDFYGRRRRLPDIAITDLYPVTVKPPKDSDSFNPILCCSNRSTITDNMLAKKLYWENEVRAAIAASQEYQAKQAAKKNKVWVPNGEMSNAKYESLAKEAIKQDVIIQAFSGRRAQAERQCVNARIQGSSATMTKIAMNKITADPELASYGFKLCIGVHDELIGEVKEEFAEKGAARLCEIMKNCVSDLFSVPFKCDPSIVSKWYEDEMAYSLQDKFQDLIATGKTAQEATEIIAKANSEFLPTEIDHLLHFEG